MDITLLITGYFEMRESSESKFLRRWVHSRKERYDPTKVLGPIREIQLKEAA
jgi:hypothetical protein